MRIHEHHKRSVASHLRTHFCWHNISYAIFSCAHKIGQSHLAGRKYPSCHSLTPHHLHWKVITGISCWNCEVAIAQNGTKRPDPQPPPALMPLLPSLGLIFSPQFILGSRFKCVQDYPSHGIAPHLPALNFQCGQTFQYPLTTSASNTSKTGKYQT